MDSIGSQTLMDEEKRADYDSLIGFSRLAVNPFQDNTFEQDQASSRWSKEVLVDSKAVGSNLDSAAGQQDRFLL